MIPINRRLLEDGERTLYADAMIEALYESIKLDHYPTRTEAEIMAATKICGSDTDSRHFISHLHRITSNGLIKQLEDKRLVRYFETGNDSSSIPLRGGMKGIKRVTRRLEITQLGRQYVETKLQADE